MAELHLDTIEDSLVELGTTDRRIIRKAKVTGITSSSPSGYMLDALRVAGMPQIRDRHPRVPDLLLQWQRVRGVAGDAVEVELEYRANITTNFNAGTLIFRDRTTVQTEVAESMYGGSFSPFTIINPADPNATAQISGRMNRITAMRQLDVDAILTFRPLQASVLVNTVNDRHWCGLPKGYWMCVRFETGFSSIDPSKFAYGSSFITRRDRNWSEWDFARDSLGRIPDGVDIAGASRLMTDAYTYGVSPFLGVTVAGQYIPIPFDKAFGFKDEFATTLNLPNKK